MSFASTGCSTISDTIDLAGIVDKTENFLFGNDEEEQQNMVNMESIQDKYGKYGKYTKLHQ